MVLVSGGRSTLNPNAPLFVPAAYRQVEDFSPEWWQLVTTSTWYHDYWLSQHQGEDGFYDSNAANDFEGSDIADLLPDTFDFGTTEDFSNMEAQFEEFIQSNESEREHKSSPFSSNNFQGNGADTMEKRLTTMKSFDDRSPKFLVQPAKYAERPANSMSPKYSYSPRFIQQPR